MLDFMLNDSFINNNNVEQSCKVMDEQFIDSIKVDYGKEHDGIGYDLGALRNLSAGEQERVENLLVRGQYQDWRDIQALDVIGSN